MGESGFHKFMRHQKKSEKTIAHYSNCLTTIAEYLWNHKRKRHLNSITKKDVKDFESWGDKNLKNVNRYIWAITAYAEYTTNFELEMIANELLGSRYSADQKLKDFPGVDAGSVGRLKAAGIITVQQMLNAGQTKNSRKRLSKETGVPLETVLELVKFSDLARIPGLRKVRARLYFDAGLDTIEKIAKWDSEELIQMLTEFIERTGFNGISLLPKEAATSIATAKYIARIIEY